MVVLTFCTVTDTVPERSYLKGGKGSLALVPEVSLVYGSL